MSVFPLADWTIYFFIFFTGTSSESSLVAAPRLVGEVWLFELHMQELVVIISSFFHPDCGMID